MRLLGKAIVKGRVNALGLHEVYDGLPLELVEIREATRADFERAVFLYQHAKFGEAGKLFEKVLQRDPDDKAAKLYLKACSQMFEKTLTASWDGAIIMDAK
jgi:hypothetical protein